MRISTSQSYDNYSSQYSREYDKMDKTNAQISSGERIQTAGDDPVASARLQQLAQQQTRLSQYSTNLDTANSALSSEDSTLSSINTLLQNARSLTVQAGDGSLSDSDRSAISTQLGDIEDELYGLMNTQDANGNYVFSGSNREVQPYIKNADGSYTYQGDQNTLALQVSDTQQLQTNDNGYSVFETSSNAAQTSSQLVASPTGDDGTQRVFLSQGTVSDQDSFDSDYRDGAPYTLEVVSDTQFKIRDSQGVDVTSEVNGNPNGTFDATADEPTKLQFRGAELSLSTSFKATDDTQDSGTLVSGYRFEFGVKPDDFAIQRNASNSSTAQISGGTVSDSTAYSTTFPERGVQLTFTSADSYDVYALPRAADSRPIGSGSVNTDASTGEKSLTVLGVNFDLSGEAATGDRFTLDGSSNRNQNVLNTLSTLRKALDTPTSDDPQAALDLQDTLAASLTNLDNGLDQVSKTYASVGSRQNVIDTLKEENQSQALNATNLQSTLGDTDMAAATSELTLQQTIIEAAQSAFASTAKLSLFDKI